MIADDLLLPDQTKRFRTWQSAKEFLYSLEGRYVFRGRRSAEWVLLTTLDRAVQYRALEAEQVLIGSFQKALPRHTANVPPLDDGFSWLALMRHYGLPSRLLDCTESPAVAAYFSSQADPDRDFAIWAIQKEGIRRATQDALGIVGGPLSAFELGSNSLFSAAFHQPKRFMALVDAQHKTQRQQAQKGLFLCPGDVGQPFWRNLPSKVGYIGFLYRVVLPPDACRAIRQDLSGTDVNCANLLPDTDHLEDLCSELGRLLNSSQQHHGPFQWSLQVKPMLMEHGLIDLNLACG